MAARKRRKKVGKKRGRKKKLSAGQMRALRAMWAARRGSGKKGRASRVAEHMRASMQRGSPMTRSMSVADYMAESMKRGSYPVKSRKRRR